MRMRLLSLDTQRCLQAAATVTQPAAWRCDQGNVRRRLFAQRCIRSEVQGLSQPSSCHKRPNELVKAHHN